MGIYSCIGKNQEEVKTSLYKGQSGIGLDPVRKEFGYRSALTGLLDKPNLKGVLGSVSAFPNRANMPIWLLRKLLHRPG